MIELDRLGWEAWVAAKRIVGPAPPPFPPPGRVAVGRPAPLRARLRDRLLLRPSGARAGDAWLAEPLRAIGPAVVHAHFGWLAVEVLPGARRAGVPLVPSFHGYDAMVWPAYGFGTKRRRRRRDPYRALFGNVPRVLAVSEFLAQRVRELGYEGEIVVVPSGTRLEAWPYRGPRAAAPSRLLFVGRLIPYKGVDVLLRALTRVRREVPAARLEVVGDGSARPALEALAAELGLVDAVAFRGAAPREAVLAAMRDADVLVVPSRTTERGQAEALGNVTKEALAVGLEVVATDHGGIPETLPPARRGELVPEGHAGALADAILAVLADRPDREARAREGRAWIEQAFDWRALAPRIAAVYERAVADGPPRG